MKMHLKKYISILICTALLILTSCSVRQDNQDVTASYPDTVSADKSSLKAAVLYCGNDNNEIWRDTLSWLKQSTLIGLHATAVDIDKNKNFDEYNILYLDASLKNSSDSDIIKKHIENYVKNGGAVVADNSLYNYFSTDFFGASDFIKINDCPAQLTFPKLGNDLKEIQEIISDFSSLYPSYADYQNLSGKDYGYAMICSDAVSLAEHDGKSIYAVNNYGKGYVFFTNPLLPNTYSVSGFDMEKRYDAQSNFSNASASCSQLLMNSFADYISKQLYGFSLERIFGSFGNPDMSWELHYEEITGIQNNALEIFTQLSKEYLQIPSFMIVRDTYWWFNRTESVSYYLNNSKNGSLNYKRNFYEDAYSSGTHISSGGEWLSLASIKDGGSYFSDYPEYINRAYPYICDYDNDGKTDIFCGSSDGFIYYYKGLGFTDRLQTEAGIKLKDKSGNDLSLGGYSAPQLCDINGDGFDDIVCGAGNGRVFWFAGDGSLTFEPRGILIDSNLNSQAFPSVGDLNNDGIPDIAVGSNSKILLVFYGEKDNSDVLSFSHKNMTGLSKLCVNSELGAWLAPEICDYDNDGINEIAVGTFDGYVALIDRDKNNNFIFTGYITTDEMNYKGNKNIKTGNNCVPSFADINSDGSPDLICGSLEYGLAYPIDSKYFPYAKQIKDEIEFANKNDIYLGLHFYTNAYASKERETYELKTHLAALKSLGVNTDKIGTNQHTWHLSSFNQNQSLMSAWNSGLLWNSGYGTSGEPDRAPQVAAENVIALPFFVTQDNQRTILTQNCSVLTYMDTKYSDMSAKYKMPTCMYYHGDFVYNPNDAAEARKNLNILSDYWWKYNYNFVSEDQMMSAVAASYNLNVEFEGGASKDHVNLKLTPKEITNNFKLYDKNYQNSCGAKLSLREDIPATNISCDASIWRREQNSFYISLDKPVVITNKSGSDNKNITSSPTRLERVNVAADITSNNNGAVIKFKDGTMMQVVISGSASTADKDWTVTERDGKTIFTKYAKAETLNINYN